MEEASFPTHGHPLHREPILEDKRRFMGTASRHAKFLPSVLEFVSEQCTTVWPAGLMGLNQRTHTLCPSSFFFTAAL